MTIDLTRLIIFILSEILDPQCFILTETVEFQFYVFHFLSCSHDNMHHTVFIHMFLPRCMECRRGLAMIILSCLSVCLSVRLSVKRVHCDTTEEQSVWIFISYEKSFRLVF